MKFILNEAEKLKILNLLDVIETNSDISEFYNNYLKYKIECEPNALEIYQTILECNELDGDEEGFVETIEPYKLKNIKQLPYDEFSNNEYLKNIKFPQIKFKSLTFEYDTYLKGEAFISEDITFDNEYRDINQFRNELNNENSVGKKLDFIIQEMNRETNTIGSKTNSLEITNLVVDIKTEIENIREQVQNIE